MRLLTYTPPPPTNRPLNSSREVCTFLLVALANRPCLLPARPVFWRCSCHCAYYHCGQRNGALGWPGLSMWNGFKEVEGC